MNNQAVLRLMGPFTLWVDGQEIGDPAEHSKKGTQLLQYLILQRGAAVDVAHLVDTLWPQGRSSEPENALKTLVSRLRGTLNRQCPGLGECIASQHGAYRFQLPEGLTVDLYQVEALLDQLSGPQQDTAETRSRFAELLTLYGKGLLPDQHSEWAGPGPRRCGSALSAPCTPIWPY